MRLGPDLIPGDDSNHQGYFENQWLWHIHERLLALLGRSWDTLSAVRPFPPLWWRTPEILRLKQELTAWADARRREGPTPWGFKDPRTIMLLPLWDEVFRDCGIQPVFVLCVRHPGAVAASLEVRDKFPQLFSELLWMERNLTACLAMQSRPHCIVHYEHWFANALKQAKLLTGVTGLGTVRGARLQEVIERTVRPGLRHDPPEGQIRSAGTREFYALLRGATTAPGRPDLRPFAGALEMARDYVAVAGQLNGVNPAGSVFSPSYDRCTVQDLEDILRSASSRAQKPGVDERTVFAPARSGLTAQMAASETPPQFNIDVVAGMTAPRQEDRLIVAAHQSNIRVEGWAVDNQSGKLASAVEVVIDEVPFCASYGLPRHDVEERLNSQDYLNCGFSFILPARFLACGKHVFSVRIVAADGSRYQKSPDLPIFVV